MSHFPAACVSKYALACALILALDRNSAAAQFVLDETPAKEAEWGYRPDEGATLAVTPPGFTWRPTKDVARWELQCRAADGGQFSYEMKDLEYSVHCPAKAFPAGSYAWRYRGINKSGQATPWSRARRFTIPAGAVSMPMPTRQDLLKRVPDAHPRLFVRPEGLGQLRALAKGRLADRYEKLVESCERLTKRPPQTAEPPTYPKGMESKSEEWLKIWWGNREYTTAALDSAATLAFTRLLGGKEEYGQLARRILMDCAEWDPKGASGYRYNDEAGMPYNYLFARTYTFVYDLLSEAEREKCRQVMKVRGEEMYDHLNPRHLWQPYASHSNRAWHKLAELGIAFHGEIPAADDWLYFAMNIFYNNYPVWSDDDGGWHEGASYWNSYLTKFTWWADVMRVAFDVDAYRKPFFSQVGYYPMYLMPPGKRWGGFGDLTPERTSKSNLGLMSIFAAQAQNPYWQWYVDSQGGPVEAGGYIGFIRGALANVEPKAPADLPTSKLFRGTGQAYLNTTIVDAEKDVQVVFKSSPFGTQSHGFEANNSFMLWAYGEQLLIPTGRRDTYGSDHHRNWMWSTRSTNNITVNLDQRAAAEPMGRLPVGQLSHSAAARGRITAFHTSPLVDVVAGEAGDAYRVESSKANPEGRVLDRFTRTILFIKPELVVVYDRLESRQPATYNYWLHAQNKFQLGDDGSLELRCGEVVCPVQFLAPQKLKLAQTDQYDPNPRSRVKVREWHVTATTAEPEKKVEFVTLMRPHRSSTTAPSAAQLRRVQNGYVLEAELSDGRLTALLPTSDEGAVRSGNLETTGAVLLERQGSDGKSHRLRVENLR